MAKDSVSRLLGTEPTKRNVNWYVVQKKDNRWSASRDMIWGEHKHRYIVRAKNVEEAIELGKKKLKKRKVKK